MQKDNHFFDDLSKLATSAAGTMMDMRREMEQIVARQIEHFLSKMHLVTREEFDVVRDMAEKARIENEALAARLDALESKAKNKAKD